MKTNSRWSSREDKEEEAEYLILEDHILAIKGLRAVVFEENNITFHYPYSQTVKIQIPLTKLELAKKIIVENLKVYCKK